ncbi:cellulase family glycosylhydrolase [Candidatus Bathyarchaeota archaeon]|jgi:hypothetical protein|nr:cellulase family glycosylhydrolase [Candidatus Bathyarchaeota archaeon]MBT4320626.1 cellulase family glycosylhydrolase [Candidatus Bathyarchaeota archaeon]MBT4424123.1 cellulase family glycosylhydrolase [Candidatus Bathyarchaeota archaeon]MBT6604102.1 cellulase family glycosylhydrolase [Candidatus Bathyarchaeota archaeon]MBT7188115.1 cellulase family glycosylhydrolase [Candidatus Bathyarchaeota archaeon]
MTNRWSQERAWEWYGGYRWLVGCNFTPSTAINQLEMWQADTFDEETIERELGWASEIGFNTARVYLHDLVWEIDSTGVIERINRFLEIASSKGIKPMFVFFDDCWNPTFEAGKQPEPKPGVHNSGWVQSPGPEKVVDPSMWGTLENYVKGILTAFGNDDRILLWDLYNEPGNDKRGSKSLGFLKEVFRWARDVDPSQPISVGVWFDNNELNAFQLANSDIVTFHDYHDAAHLEEQISRLKEQGRPMICTEYMARTNGSFFKTSLPVFKRENVGCINWGLVDGKTQTKYPWGSEPGSPEPELWFHEIFHGDGIPYLQDEVDLIRRLTSSE